MPVDAESTTAKAEATKFDLLFTPFVALILGEKNNPIIFIPGPGEEDRAIAPYSSDKFQDRA